VKQLKHETLAGGKHLKSAMPRRAHDTNPEAEPMPLTLFRTSVAAALIVSAAALFGSMVPGIGMTVAPAVEENEEEVAMADLCRGAAWPYLPAECLRSADGSPVPEVRWVTVETRISENESMLLAAPLAR
jgi:hypothetical protein